MNTHQIRIDHLTNQINTATNKADLLPFWDKLSFERQKALMIGEMHKISENEERARKYYFNTSSLTDIMPNELITNILSFDCYNRYHPLICKTANKSFKINERMIAKKEESQKKRQEERVKAIQNEKNKYLQDFVDENTEYWVVDPYHDILTPEEIEKGYRGPETDLSRAIRNCRSNSVIFIHPYGRFHTIPEVLGKKIALVGVDEKNKVPIGYGRIQFEQELYFENINFFSTSMIGGMFIREDIPEKQIDVYKNLTCILCEFDFEWILRIEEPSVNVEMRGCKLKSIYVERGSEQMGSLIMIGNLFDIGAELLFDPIHLEQCITNAILKDNAVAKAQYFRNYAGWQKSHVPSFLCVESKEHPLDH